MQAMPETAPFVEFFQLVPNSRPPLKADRAVGGTISTRALRYCEAITSASGFGWYVFLPMRFRVVWDGHDMLWTYDGTRRVAAVIESCAVSRIQGPFRSIRARPRQGVFANLPLTIHPARRVANMDRLHCQDSTRLEPAGSRRRQPVEEPRVRNTRRYHRNRPLVWALFDNIQILKTDTPIEFRNDIPFLQVQPVHKEVYSDKFLRNFVVKEMHELGPDNWEKFHRTVVTPNIAPERTRGGYAISARKRGSLASRPQIARPPEAI